MSQFGGQAWTQVPDGEWYLHLFTPEQPDLNWELPEIREEFHSILRFWLDRGVDGFRIDVAHGLAKDHREPLRDLEPDDNGEITPRGGEDNPLWDRDDVHDIYRGWHEVLAGYPGDRMAVAEAWVASPERRARYVRPDELSQAFNFDFLRAEWGYASLRKSVESELATVALVGAAPTWVLANHDVVREVTRYGDGPSGSAEHAPGRCCCSRCRDRRTSTRARSSAFPRCSTCLPTSCRTPSMSRPTVRRMGRDGCRVPIPWSGTAQPFGFGPEGSRPWLPQPDSWRALSAQAESEDAASMLVLYRNALALRQFVRGDAELTWLDGRRRGGAGVPPGRRLRVPGELRRRGGRPAGRRRGAPGQRPRRTSPAPR